MLDSSSPPSWLRPLSLRWVDLSSEYFGAAARRLAGGEGPCPRTPRWRQAWSDVVHSRRTLEGLKEAGVTAVCLHYDDGFGHVAQAEDIRQAAQFAAACRDLDLRVFARIEGGALYYETLLTDRPGLAAWAQRDPRGDLVPADGGRPAWRPCYRSRGFLELLKDSIPVACDQLQADGVLLANFGPHACHCERCQHGFRRMLMQRHPEPRKSLGLPSLEHVRLPAGSAPADPLHYEAAYFGVYALRSALAELRIHLRSVSTHLALWAEPRPGAASESCAAFWELCAPLDVVTCEDAAGGGRDETAARAAHYLAGHATRTSVHLRACPGKSSEGHDHHLATCLGGSMAFGGHVLGNHEALRCDGCAPETPDDSMAPRFASDGALRQTWTHLLDFAARHEHYHHRAESIAEVALAFSLADIAGSPRDHAERLEAQRALLEAGIPFDIVPLQGVEPDRHRLVVIAGQARVSDEEAVTVCALAERGCAVLLVGSAGSRDAHGRRRATGAFAPIGRLPHVRGLQLAAEDTPEARAARIATGAAELLPHPRLLEIAGPPDARGRVFVCPFRLPTGQATIHLLNTGGPVVEGLRLHVRADLAPTRHVAWHQPEAADALLDCTVEGASIVTALPPLQSYALVITS